MQEVSGGKLDYAWPAKVNKLLRDGGHDLILSVGQVVPHEVVGMANYNKNIFVGTGGVMVAAKRLGPMFGMTIRPFRSLVHRPVDAGSMIGLFAVSKAIGSFGRCASVRSAPAAVLCMYLVHRAFP